MRWSLLLAVGCSAGTPSELPPARPTGAIEGAEDVRDVPAPDDPPVHPPVDDTAALPPGEIETLTTLGLHLVDRPLDMGNPLLGVELPRGGVGNALVLPVGPPEAPRLIGLGFTSRRCGRAPAIQALDGTHLGCFPWTLTPDGARFVAARQLPTGDDVIVLAGTSGSPSDLVVARLDRAGGATSVATLADSTHAEARGFAFSPGIAPAGYALMASGPADTEARLYRATLAVDGSSGALVTPAVATLPIDDLPYQFTALGAGDGEDLIVTLMDPPGGVPESDRPELVHVRPDDSWAVVQPFLPDSAVFWPGPGDPLVGTASLWSYRPMGMVTFCNHIQGASLAFALGPFAYPDQRLDAGCHLVISSTHDPTPAFRWADFPRPPSLGDLIDASNVVGVDGALRTPRLALPGGEDAYLRAWGGLAITVVTQPAEVARVSALLGFAGGDDGATARQELLQLSEHGLTFYSQAITSGPHPRRAFGDPSRPSGALVYETARPEGWIDAGRFYSAWSLFEGDELGPDLPMVNPRSVLPLFADGTLLVGVANAHTTRPAEARAFTWTSDGRCELWTVQPRTPGALVDTVALRDRLGQPLSVTLSFTSHLSTNVEVDPRVAGTYLALCDGVTLDDDRPARRVAGAP